MSVAFPVGTLVKVAILRINAERKQLSASMKRSTFSSCLRIPPHLLTASAAQRRHVGVREQCPKVAAHVRRRHGQLPWSKLRQSYFEHVGARRKAADLLHLLFVRQMCV